MFLSLLQPPIVPPMPDPAPDPYGPWVGIGVALLAGILWGLVAWLIEAPEAPEPEAYPEPAPGHGSVYPAVPERQPPR